MSYFSVILGQKLRRQSNVVTKVENKCDPGTTRQKVSSSPSSYEATDSAG